MNLPVSRFDELHAEVHPEYLHHCSGVAYELGQLLMQQGTIPTILKIATVDPIELLLPLPYDKKLKWIMHIICTDGETVYDPIFPEPRTLETYFNDAFGTQAIETIDVSASYRRIASSGA